MNLIKQDRLRLYAAVAVSFLISLPSVSNAEGMSVQEATRMMIQTRDICKVYVNNGERFWRGDFKKPEDAPGLVLLNKEIQTYVRKARSSDAAKEIAWQKCLDVVYNNQNSKDYVR
jgi:hypothetical protein